MAVLFSKVEMRSDYSTTEFLVSGIPVESSNLEGIPEYHDFLNEISEDMIINVYAEAYEYGEGKSLKATPEDIEYLKRRLKDNPRFLTNHCREAGQSNFNVSWYPSELFGGDEDESDKGEETEFEITRNIEHAEKAKQHCKAIKDAINGLCDILDMSDDPFDESGHLVYYKHIFQMASSWERKYDDYIFEQKENAAIAACMKHKFTIKDFLLNDTVVYPRMGLYEVRDFTDRPMHIHAIQLYTETGEPYATLTKSFGEFIGAKNCAYIDTNNCPFAKELLSMGAAKDTFMLKPSGYCKYPLWEFDEAFLRDIGGEAYEQYSNEFEAYMHPSDDENIGDGDFEMKI